MVEQAKEILQSSGLDTLSERALRRLTDSWTGSLHSVDTLLDASSQTQVASSSTFRNIVEQWRMSREIYHEASMESLMGEGASYADGVKPLAEVATHISTPDVEQALQSVADMGVGEFMPLLYNVFIAVGILYYIFCAYRYFDDIVVLFRSVFQRQVVSTDRAEERRRSDIFYGSLGKLFMMGVVFVGLIVSMFVWRANTALTMSQLFYLPFVAMAMFVVVIIAQYCLLAVVGVVTRSMYEISALMRIRLIYFVMAVVMVAPVLLISQMDASGSSHTWLNISYIAALLAFVLFIRESVAFFISKKVSILHWILYLCAVEILPFTLLWQGVVRLA